MPVNSSEFARSYHERTKHSWRSVRSQTGPLDWANQPLPFKVYPTLQPIPLPVDLPERELPAARGLVGPASEAGGPLDLRELARLLFFSCGVTRPLRRGGRWLHFRAAPSAGALYPVEVYVVCADLPALAAGVYHFAPAEFALRRLRAGDFRSALADAAAQPVAGQAPATLVLTGIPWRTTWKYRARGYRHLYWDAGAILANVLALAEAAATPARVLAGFADAAVARLLDLGDPDELPLTVVPLGTAGPHRRRARRWSGSSCRWCPCRPPRWPTGWCCRPSRQVRSPGPMRSRAGGGRRPAGPPPWRPSRSRRRVRPGWTTRSSR
jgi:SagB-type dehydrogenase family enzyme